MVRFPMTAENKTEYYFQQRRRATTVTMRINLLLDRYTFLYTGDISPYIEKLRDCKASLDMYTFLYTGDTIHIEIERL